MTVIRTITLKIDVTPDERQFLLHTMKDYTIAFNVCAEWGFDSRSCSKIRCHNATYCDIRQTVPNLPSSLVQSARDCACEALKATKCKFKPLRKEFSAMRYNQRVIRIYMETGYATIATSNGRIKAMFTVPGYYHKYMNWKIKSSTVSFRKRDKTFYLHCQLETPTPEQTNDINVLGIDRGIVNIAVCSDNTFYNSKLVKNTRAKFAHLRAELQSKGTRSAKRKLRKMAGRERRFVTDVDHCISKQIVNSDYTVFALENLSKIRVQKRRGKDFNRKLNNWSFYELERFIRYKSENLGKSVVLVDARYTSQKCSLCGHIYKGNRDGSSFRCRKCGFQIHADLNAARNIAHAGISGLGRLSVNQPNVACL